MDAHDTRQITETFRQIAEAALTDPTLAQQVRDALVESGLLSVFGVGAAVDLLDLLDTGGVEGLRAYLRGMALAQLREIVQTRHYDPDKTTARWRSVNKFVELIVTRAEAELAAELAQEQAVVTPQQPAALAAASWML